MTVGSPDANGAPASSNGFVKYATVGNAGGPDDSDVQITVSMTDIRNKAGLADYTGQLQVTHTLRITDRLNGNSEALPGTAGDLAFPVTVGCTPTGGPANIGSTCSTTTSADAVLPGSAPEGKRSIWAFGQVTVNDGGSDGLVSTGPNTVFAKQGVFIP